VRNRIVAVVVVSVRIMCSVEMGWSVVRRRVIVAISAVRMPMKKKE